MDSSSTHNSVQMLELTVCVQLQKDMVGAFPFKSNKAARKHTAEQGRCVAHMFVMHVVEELPTWPEGTERKRIWVSAYPQAAHFVDQLWYFTATTKTVYLKRGQVLDNDVFVSLQQL